MGPGASSQMTVGSSSSKDPGMLACEALDCDRVRWLGSPVVSLPFLPIRGAIADCSLPWVG